jgi:DNA-binding transcriptional ArsR family regulator
VVNVFLKGLLPVTTGNSADSRYLCSMENKFVEKASNAVADKYRLAILLEIARKGSVSPSEVQELTGLSQPCVSHHVKILTESDLILSQKEGRSVNLRINKEKMGQLSQFFTQLSNENFLYKYI